MKNMKTFRDFSMMERVGKSSRFSNCAILFVSYLEDGISSFIKGSNPIPTVFRFYKPTKKSILSIRDFPKIPMFPTTKVIISLKLSLVKAKCFFAKLTHGEDKCNFQSKLGIA